MRSMKLGLLALLITLLIFAFGNMAMALHTPASLKCMACHTIHASYDGGSAGVTPGNGFTAAPAGGVAAGGNPRLLLQPTAMALCLVCHDGTDVSLGPAVMGTPAATTPLPGGSFTPTVADSTLGHSLKDWDEDSVDEAPGGTYATASLQCISCHDEHGDPSECFTTFRNVLKDPNRDENPVVGAYDGFIESDIHDGAVNVAQSDTGPTVNHNVYKLAALTDNGVGAWCAECHGTGFHTTAKSGDPVNWYKHPTANALLNGTDYGSYMWTYPVETTEATAAKATSWTTDELTDRVMCLSCHNAHGSANDSAMKWNATAASGIGIGCNKCHKKGS